MELGCGLHQGYMQPLQRLRLEGVVAAFGAAVEPPPAAVADIPQVESEVGCLVPDRRNQRYQSCLNPLQRRLRLERGVVVLAEPERLRAPTLPSFRLTYGQLETPPASV